jgi:hypothetical protein
MQFLAGGSVEPVLDFTTKQHKLDRETNRPLYQVRLNVFYRDGDQDRTEIIVVKTTDPTPIPPMTPVHPVELVAIPWANNGKNGVAYRAAAIRPVQSSAKAS